MSGKANPKGSGTKANAAGFSPLPGGALLPLTQGEQTVDSTVKLNEPGRHIWITGTKENREWTVKVEYRGGFWLAVELNEFGGFHGRLYDGRSRRETRQ